MQGLSILISVGEQRLRFTLEPGGPGVTVGRSHDVEVSVGDSSVSRRHCTIRLNAAGHLEVSDLASANGTTVNGARVGESMLMKPSDALRAGKVDLKITVESPAGGRPPSSAEGPAATSRPKLGRGEAATTRAPLPERGDRASRHTPAPNTQPASDIYCESCKRLVTLSTVKDGQIVAWGDRILCPACMDVANLSNLDGVERLVTQLSEEGFTVLTRLSLANSLSPVFKAKRTALGDVVAVKALPLSEGRVGKKLQRFQTEARAMAQIQHPNVVRVFDVRTRPDFIYLVMEFVEGETLLRKIERDGKVPLATGLAMGVALAKALEATAKQGIVHRDVKPANIVVAKDGTPKLSDFGLSKDLLLVGGQPTGEFEALGTIRYMPPEQAMDARGADYRSDIYSLAATLFHVLTGKVPYPGVSDVELLRFIVSRKLPPFDPTGTEGIPEPVCRVLTKALKADPAERHRSAQAFREDLVQAIAASGPAAGGVATSPAVGRPRPTTGTSVVGAMAGTFGNEQLVELVQMLGLNQKSGFLAVTWPAGDGQLAFRDGKIVAVRTRAGGKGADAALEILGLPAGDFDFRPGIPPNFKAEHTLAVEGLLMEALRRRDERR